MKKFLIILLAAVLLTPSIGHAQVFSRSTNAAKALVTYSGTVLNISDVMQQINYPSGSTPVKWPLGPNTQAIIKLSMPATATNINFNLDAGVLRAKYPEIVQSQGSVINLSELNAVRKSFSNYALGGFQANIKLSNTNTSQLEILRIERDIDTGNVSLIVYIPSSYRATTGTQPTINVLYNGSIISSNLPVTWSNSSTNAALVNDIWAVSQNVFVPYTTTVHKDKPPFVKVLSYYKHKVTGKVIFQETDASGTDYRLNISIPITKWDGPMKLAGYNFDHYEFALVFNGDPIFGINIVTVEDINTITGKIIPMGSTVMTEKSRMSAYDYGYKELDNRGQTVVLFKVDENLMNDYFANGKLANQLPFNFLRIKSGSGILSSYFPVIYRWQRGATLPQILCTDHINRPTQYCTLNDVY